MRIKQLRIKGRIIRLFRLIVNTGYMLLHKRADEIVLNVSMNLLCNKVFHSNIGDDINYYLIKELSHKRILNYWDFFNLRKQPNFMVIGSIIGWMTNKDSIIWGSGVREPDNPLPAFLVRYWLLEARLHVNILCHKGWNARRYMEIPLYCYLRFTSPYL